MIGKFNGTYGLLATLIYLLKKLALFSVSTPANYIPALILG